MNFQAVSVGEKLIDSHGVTGGYVNPISDPLGPLGKPSPSLYSEITFVDAAIGKLVSELKLKGFDKSTMIIISAKHGQSPIDLSRWTPINTPLGRPSKLLSSLVAGSSEDDVALLWLNHSTDTITAVTMLEANEAAAGIGEIFAGPSMKLLFGDPTVDPRVPDIAVQPDVGVIYTGNTSKVAEHGGFAHDDTNVMLLVSNPQMSPSTVTTPVETAQIAPTIIKVLGFDANELDAVRLEHTQVLPGVHFPD
jgi:arylsulfatase A-like enzyme